MNSQKEQPKKNLLPSSSPLSAEGVHGHSSETGSPETASFSTKVSEVIGDLPSEDLSQTGSSASSSQTTTLPPEERKERLLAQLSSDEHEASVQMQSEIQHVVDQKISRLEKEIQKSASPYRLNLVLQELRNLYGILTEMATATFEYLKTLWLKLVHGLSF